MRGRTKVISLATMLAIVLVASLVFAAGLVNVSTLSLFSVPPAELQQTTPKVSIEPFRYLRDYLNDPGYQIGDTFVIDINITDATDLFSWQVNITWSLNQFDRRMLNFTGISAYGDFLARTSSPYGTSRIEKIYIANNLTGYASVAETILGDVVGITGSGRLVRLQFLIIDYGVSAITISVAGNLPTMLLNSAGATMTFTTNVTRGSDGFFRNKLDGDANGDAIVDLFDRGALSSRWTGAPGALPYSRFVDNNDDGFIDIFDRGITSSNWGRSVVP